MRLQRALFPLLIFLLALLAPRVSNAQIFQCVEGVDYTTFTSDTMRVVSFQGLPGDTVEMPLFLKADSVVLALTTNIRYDATLLTPLLFVDSLIGTRIDSTVIPFDTIVDTTVVERLNIREAGRAVKTRTIFVDGFPVIDTIDLFRSNSVKVRDSSILKVQWLSKLGSVLDPLDSMPGGAGEIARVKFTVNATILPIGTLSPVSLDHIPVLDTTFFPPVQIACALTATAQNWVVQFDTTQEVLSLLQVSTLASGFFKLDTKPDIPPCIVAGDCTPIAGFTVDCISSTCVYTPIDTSSCVTANDCTSPPAGFTFPATCDGNGNCVYTQIPINTHRPIIAPVTPNVITIKQGELVSFTVSATDDTASHVITLTGANLPAGATFNSTPSAAAATGVFNWTPTLSQSGSFVVSFNAVDNPGANAATTVSVTITVEKLEFDQLFTTSVREMSPAGGIPGFTPVLFPIDLISLKDSVFGVQFDLMYPHRQIEIDSILTTPRTPTFIVDWLSMNDSLIRVVTLGLNNEAILPDQSSAVLQIALHMDSTALPGTYNVILLNGREAIDPNPAIGSVPLLTLPGIIDVDRFGDVNLDMLVDVADLVNVVAYIIGNFGLPLRQFATADVSLNDTVDVVDLVGINNLIFDLPITPGPSPVSGGTLASVELDQGDIRTGEWSNVSLLGDFPEEVAGMEFRIEYDPATVSVLPPELTDVSRRYRLRYNNDRAGEMRVVIYNTSPWNTQTLIPEGLSEVMRIPALLSSRAVDTDIKLTNVTLANPSAGKIETELPPEPVLPKTFKLEQNYPNPFNPTTTIAYSIGVDSDGAKAQDVRLDVFNILGQRVKILIDGPKTPGDYTVEWDGSNSNGNSVATGIYLYRLQVGATKRDTKKMILLK
jgi:Putative Ig domain/FlgD Ig-like domain